MYQENYTMNQEVNIPSISDMLYLEMGYAYKIGDEDGFSGFKRNIFGDASIVRPIRAAQNNTGLYKTAFYYSSKDPYASYIYGDFFMDFDSEEDVELAKEDLLYAVWFFHLKLGFNLPMEAFHIYFSGMKGFHLMIPATYFGYQPSMKLDEYFKWVANEVNHRSPNKTLDLGIYERRRLFRLENSIHQDSGLYKIPLHYDELVELSLEEIQELAKKPRQIGYPTPKTSVQAEKEWLYYMNDYEAFKRMQREKIGRTPTIKKGVIPDSVQEIIDRGPVKGLRNETLAALTSFYKNQGYNEDEIFELLLEWNNGSTNEREVKTTMNSILKKDLNYGINRFKSLAEGEIASYEEDYKEYREKKRRG